MYRMEEIEVKSIKGGLEKVRDNIGKWAEVKLTRDNRVELSALSKDDFIKILKEPENNLIKQYVELISTEGVKLNFSEKAISEIAKIASNVNEEIENIGARRLHTILEKVLEEISFSASEKKSKIIEIDDKYVKDQIGDIYKDSDLSKFIL